MSIIHINQIQRKVFHLFANELDLSDISDSDQEREDKINTRCF